MDTDGRGWEVGSFVLARRRRLPGALSGGGFMEEEMVVEGEMGVGKWGMVG